MLVVVHSSLMPILKEGGNSAFGDKPYNLIHVPGRSVTGANICIISEESKLGLVYFNQIFNNYN